MQNPVKYFPPTAWLSATFLSLLVLLLFFSSVALVLVRFDNRQLFTEVQRLEQQGDELQVEWQQLQLEQSVWAEPVRIETLAREKLHMYPPSPHDIILLTP